jgi:hypothetical protein
MALDADRIAVSCMRMVLSDEPWHDLGYKRRPRYGGILKRLRPQWKVALENKMLQQMIALLSVAYISGFGCTRHLQQQLVNKYLATPELITAFGYSSQFDGVSDLNEAIDEYASSDRQGWHKILIGKLDAMNIPDKKVRGRLIVGCITFCRSVEAMTAYLPESRQ